MVAMVLEWEKSSAPFSLQLMYHFVALFTLSLASPIDYKAVLAVPAAAALAFQSTEAAFVPPVKNVLSSGLSQAVRYGRPAFQNVLPTKAGLVALRAFKDPNELPKEVVEKMLTLNWRPVMSLAEIQAVSELDHPHLAYDRFEQFANRWVFLQEAIIEEKEKAELDPSYKDLGESRTKTLMEELKKVYKDLKVRGASWDNEDAKAFVAFQDKMHANPKYLETKAVQANKKQGLKDYYQKRYGEQNAELGKADHPKIDPGIETARRRLELLWKKQPLTINEPLELE